MSLSKGGRIGRLGAHCLILAFFVLLISIVLIAAKIVPILSTAYEYRAAVTEYTHRYLEEKYGWNAEDYTVIQLEPCFDWGYTSLVGFRYTGEWRGTFRVQGDRYQVAISDRTRLEDGWCIDGCDDYQVGDIASDASVAILQIASRYGYTIEKIEVHAMLLSVHDGYANGFFCKDPFEPKSGMPWYLNICLSTAGGESSEVADFANELKALCAGSCQAYVELSDVDGTAQRFFLNRDKV